MTGSLRLWFLQVEGYTYGSKALAWSERKDVELHTGSF